MKSHEQGKHGIIVKMEIVAAMEIVGGEEVSSGEDLVTDNIIHVLICIGLEAPDILDFLAFVEVFWVTVDS